MNFTSKGYFFNRYYLDEMQLYDVEVFEDYAILIGYDAHKVVFHSVYNGFILHSLESHSYFSQPMLLRVSALTGRAEDKYYDHTILGLSKGQVKLYSVRNYPANVNCWAKDNFKKVGVGGPMLQNYQVYVYSQDCAQKRSHNDTSFFSRCFSYHKIEYEAKDVSHSSITLLELLLPPRRAQALRLRLRPALPLLLARRHPLRDDPQVGAQNQNPRTPEAEAAGEGELRQVQRRAGAELGEEGRRAVRAVRAASTLYTN